VTSAAGTPQAVRRTWWPAASHPLLGYIMRRIAAGVVLVLIVSVLVFLGTIVLPGDAARAILGRYATPAQIRVLRHQLGLDRPLLEQYWSWLSNLVRGRFGESFTAQEPVTTYIHDRVINTLALAAVTMAVCIPLSILLGTLSALRRGRLTDRAVTSFTLGAISVPEFVTGSLIALLIGVKLGIFPPVSLVAPGQDPLSVPNLLVLPALTLLLSLLAYSVRMVRAGVLETLSSDYVRAAVLGGASTMRILRRHVLPNAIAPSIQVFALTAQWLLGGIVVVETVFQYPGLGQGLVQAVSARDIPVVQTICVLLAALYIAINIVADVLVILLVPRLRTQATHG
jgi:peptide/nickel transport system permease protein